MNSNIPRYDAMLLIAHGGPEREPDVLPFLRNLLRGRPASESRLQEIARRYRAIGGRSPLKEQTMRQAAAVQKRLAEQGVRVAVRVGMRAWSPYIRDTLEELKTGGARRVLGVVLAPFESETSHRRYRGEVNAALKALGPEAPAVEYAPSFHLSEGFIRSSADGVLAALEEIPGPKRPRARLIFTAHSIPLEAAERSAYASQLQQSARLTAQAAGCADYRVAYQSCSGPPGEPWLEPDLGRVIREEVKGGAESLVAAPIGFVCDSLEVLYDLDVEAAAQARALGANLVRAPTIRDHPAFVEALAGMITGQGRPAG